MLAALSHSACPRSRRGCPCGFHWQCQRCSVKLPRLHVQPHKSASWLHSPGCLGTRTLSSGYTKSLKTPQSSKQRGKTHSVGTGCLQAPGCPSGHSFCSPLGWLTWWWGVPWGIPSLGCIAFISHSQATTCPNSCWKAVFGHSPLEAARSCPAPRGGSAPFPVAPQRAGRARYFPGSGSQWCNRSRGVRPRGRQAPSIPVGVHKPMIKGYGVNSLPLTAEAGRGEGGRKGGG